jgi:hypothetical protein
MRRLQRGKIVSLPGEGLREGINFSVRVSVRVSVTRKYLTLNPPPKGDVNVSLLGEGLREGFGDATI